MTGERVALQVRRPERDDLAYLVDWMRDAPFMELLFGGDAQARQVFREQVMSVLGAGFGIAFSSTGHFLLEMPDHEPIAMIALQDLAWRNRSGGFELYLAPNRREEPYFSSAYFHAVKYCFHELNLHRVSVRTRPEEDAVRAVLEEVGAVREVLLRKHAVRDATPEDVLVYGILRNDFDKYLARSTTDGTGHGA